MKLNHALLAAVALGAIVAPNAHAATKKHVKHHARAAAAAPRDTALRGEVDELKAQIASLRDELRSQRDTAVATQTQVAQTQAQVGTINQEIAATPPMTKADVKAVAHTEIATAVEAEHHRDNIPYKGIKITPGGFIELAGIYRQHFQGNDISSSWAIPLANSHNYYTGESRLTARQSRFSLLAQGKPSEHVTLSLYTELDLQGAAQTANSNESNSYNPRLRHFYGTIDWDQGQSGWHLLAGQNWSLVTMNSKGITPRAEVTPATIEAQYVPGFSWTRTPQLRLTGDFLDHHLWLAVSAENAATTFGGTVPATVTNVIAGGSGFNSANNLSLNTIPDFVGKAAYEGDIAGHALHIEGIVLERSFTDRVNNVANNHATSTGFGGGVTLDLVPKMATVQFSALTGKGIGRYGTAQLSDVTLDANGTIHPIQETMMLAGLQLHPNKMLDIYGYAGEEYERAMPLSSTYGVGNILANNAGCFTEGGTCGAGSRRIRQITGGLWQKIYNGSFGRAQVGAQYSYTERQLFQGAGYSGLPQVNQSIGMISFRYYPF